MFNAMLWSFSKKENSTKRPSDGAATVVQCETNNDFDLLNPVFVFSFQGGASNPTHFNYCYVKEFKRYYWINSWTFSNGQWFATCAVDALASWKTEIGNTSAYVLRAAADYDGNIQDNIYPAKMDVVLASSTTDSPFDENGEYVVGTVSDGGITDYGVLTPAQFKIFSEAAFSDSFYNGVAQGVEWMAKAAFDPMQYLRLVMFLPFESGGGGRAIDMKLGWWDTGVSGIRTHAGSKRITSFTLNIPKHPQAASRGAYLNCAPYSSYVLDCRPWGRIVIDPELLKNISSITFNIEVDVVTGEGVLYANVSNARRILAVAQVGQPVQLSQVTHNVGGAILSAASGIASAAAGNAIGAVAGVGNAVNSIMGKASTIGVNGSTSQFDVPPQIDATFLQIVDENNEDLGRPLMQKRTLNTLAGYQLVSDPEVIAPCSHSEAQAIKAYLEGGYHYE